MAVKADFVNPFLSGAITTFIREFGQEPAVGQVTATMKPLVSGGVSVVIGLTGQVRGVVIYDMEVKTSKVMAGIMAGMPVPVFDEMAESAVAELGNVITGLASAGLEERGYQAAISPPSVVTGHGTQLAVPETVRLVVPLELPAGTVRVYLALHEA